MKTWSQMDLMEREKLFGLLKQGESIRSCARRIGRSHTTLMRELKKHTKYGKAYIPCLAQRRHEYWTKRQRSRSALKNTQVYVYVREKLRLGWSPEAIEGRLPLDELHQSISHETVYSYIYKNKRRKRDFVKYLTQKHGKRRKQTGRSVNKLSKIAHAVPIRKRHFLVDTRTTIGHWEGDLMEGLRSDHKVLSVEVERVTRFTKLSLLPSKKSLCKSYALTRSLHPLPKRARKTLTVDNGPENSSHQTWTKELGIKVYFCAPYHSWEKGSVENMNGRIRRYIPKGMSIETITHEQIVALEEILNNTPRKCLGYKTPNEKMREMLQYKASYNPKWCNSI